MSLARTILAFAVVSMLAACDEPPISEPPLEPVSVTPTHVYAGSAFTIASRRFSALQDVAIYADTFLLKLRGRSGDTVVVEMPTTARGQYLIRLGHSGTPVGTVSVAGYVGTSAHEMIGWELDVLSVSAAASVISGNGTGVLQYFPGTNTVKTLVAGFPTFGINQRYLGRTPSPGRVLLQPASGNVESWRLAPEPHRLTELPTSIFRDLHQLSDSIFLRVTKYALHTERVRNGRFEPVYSGPFLYRESSRAVISPRGDRASIEVLYTPLGLPVFNTATGDTVYHVRGMQYFRGVEFSSNGDFLWVLGKTSTGLMLLKLNATTGAEVGRLELPEHPGGLALDHGAGRIFLATAANGTNLLIVDPVTLEVKGRARAPESTWSCCSVIAFGLDGVFIVDLEKTLRFDYIH